MPPSRSPELARGRATNAAQLSPDGWQVGCPVTFAVLQQVADLCFVCLLPLTDLASYCPTFSRGQVSGSDPRDLTRGPPVRWHWRRPAGGGGSGRLGARGCLVRRPSWSCARADRAPTGWLRRARSTWARGCLVRASRAGAAHGGDRAPIGWPWREWSAGARGGLVRAGRAGAAPRGRDARRDEAIWSWPRLSGSDAPNSIHG